MGGCAVAGPASNDFPLGWRRANGFRRSRLMMIGGVPVWVDGRMDEYGTEEGKKGGGIEEGKDGREGKHGKAREPWGGGGTKRGYVGVI
jgi:hypothetical protein